MKKITQLVLVAFGALILIALVLSGCSDRVQGDQTVNQKPIVSFVNVPPDGYKVSVNPVVFWVGTDADGLVMQYRYVVVPVIDMNGMGPDEYANAVLAGSPSDIWTYIDVSVENPGTTNEIPASADLDDPVNKFVSQYIFVQAIDDQELGSDIVFKLVLRNDFPPDTEIRGVSTSKIYINAAEAGAIVTGVPINWRAEDPDLEDSLFEFEWRMLGPYDDDQYAAMLDSFMIQVFVGNDAKLYPFWQGERILVIDTTYDSTGLVVDTTIHLVDTFVESNFLGQIDTSFLLMDDILASSDTAVNKQLDASNGWVTSTGKTMYNLFREPTDSTIVRKFLFWIRCRDQAQVPDLTPDWTEFTAIEPRYERGPVIVDFSKTILRWNAPYPDTTFRTFDSLVPQIPQAYWKKAITEWDPAVGAEFDVDNILDGNGAILEFSKDYVQADLAGLKVSLQQLLSHKLIILYNDDIEASGISLNGVPTAMGRNIYTAIDAGVNAWVVMRAPIEGGKGVGPKVGGQGGVVTPDPQYSYYFGVSEMVFSAWGYWAFDQNRVRQTVRIEDFVGTTSPTGWPVLEIDSTLLHRNYRWSTAFTVFGSPFQWGGGVGGIWPQAPPLDPKCRALPEVNWASRVYGTELMYLYKSFYGSSHFMGEFYNFDGTPVAHQLDRGIFRTVHFCFTPMAMDTIAMQEVNGRVLDFLWNPAQFEPTSSVRYPGAKATTEVSVAREKYLQGIAEDIQRSKDEGTYFESHKTVK